MLLDAPLPVGRTTPDVCEAVPVELSVELAVLVALVAVLVALCETLEELAKLDEELEEVEVRLLLLDLLDEVQRLEEDEGVQVFCSS